jgi:hypothetical protein
MTFNRSMTRDIAIGTPVFTRDNEKLGEVKAFRGEAFQVSAPMQPDYWLPTTCLRSDATGQVVVDATKDHIGDLKIADPRPQ